METIKISSHNFFLNKYKLNSLSLPPEHLRKRWNGNSSEVNCKGADDDALNVIKIFRRKISMKLSNDDGEEKKVNEMKFSLQISR